MRGQNTHRRPTRKRYDEEAVPYNEDNRPYILHHASSGFSGLDFPFNSVFRVSVERNSFVFGQDRSKKAHAGVAMGIDRNEKVSPVWQTELTYYL